MTDVDQDVIQHSGEESSNDVRSRISHSEPKALRTYTSSLAVLANSAGAYHWTPEGRKLADFSSGVLVANLGHHPSQWWSDVLQHLGLDRLSSDDPYLKAQPLTAYNAITPIELVACERLLQSLRNAPGGRRLEHVMWAASGSEAIQKALWAAMRQKPGRDMIVATRGGFHGKKGLAGAITGGEQDAERDPRVRFISFPKQECDDLTSRSQPIDLTRYRDELQTLAADCGDRLCCLVTEPYLGGGGSYHPQPEYLQLLQEFCREHDLLFILDEIQSNFGRTGAMYAFTHYGIEPDVVCLGKGLGNGVPVSAAVGPRSVFDSLDFGEGSDTWSANPLAAAAVVATLDAFERDRVVENAGQLSQVIERGLVRLKETGLIGKVRGEGNVWGIECNSIGGVQSTDVANRCVTACYYGDENGRAVHLLGPLAGNVIRISPPLTMPADEAGQYLDAIYEIFAALAEELAAA
ncbi:MAG: aminotransferase class III-fold pyridoxal phosphate-dependent enzyme [Pirellulaceae bacterium]|jgi:4-aminobutyrate aminotransferase-like enzyme|nr:aminotransferase class III-fold pyridoxal phosphate-dependent enzyme [Pirellulaceae bacterium]